MVRGKNTKVSSIATELCQIEVRTQIEQEHFMAGYDKPVMKLVESGAISFKS